MAIIAHDGFELEMTHALLGPQNNPGPLISFLYSIHVPIGPCNQVSLCAIKIGQTGRMPSDGSLSRSAKQLAQGPSFRMRGGTARWLRV